MKTKPIPLKDRTLCDHCDKPAKHNVQLVWVHFPYNPKTASFGKMNEIDDCDTEASDWYCDDHYEMWLNGDL